MNYSSFKQEFLESNGFGATGYDGEHEYLIYSAYIAALEGRVRELEDWKELFGDSFRRREAMSNENIIAFDKG